MKLIPSIPMPAWVTELKLITSRCESCHKSLALRHLASRKAGIRMRGHWYCSSPCFRTAAQREILRLLKPGTEPARYVSRMPLGLSLISQGLLTVEQLKKANDEQKEVGGEIGELLLGQGLVSEKQLTAARAKEWGCPVFTVPKQPIEVGINLPSALMRIYSMVPVHYGAGTNLLLVGFVQNVEYGLLYATEQITGCETKPCFVTPGDFQVRLQQQEAEQKQTGYTPARERTFDKVQTPAEIARTLCAAGIEIEADEALLERCKECIWARLKSGTNSLDLLFKAV